MDPAATRSDDAIERALEFWKPRLAQDLSADGGRQIIENVVGFFATLAEWARAEVKPVDAATIAAEEAPDGPAAIGEACAAQRPEPPSAALPSPVSVG